MRKLSTIVLTGSVGAGLAAIWAPVGTWWQWIITATATITAALALAAAPALADAAVSEGGSLTGRDTPTCPRLASPSCSPLDCDCLARSG